MWRQFVDPTHCRDRVMGVPHVADDDRRFLRLPIDLLPKRMVAPRILSGFRAVTKIQRKRFISTGGHEGDEGKADTSGAGNNTEVGHFTTMGNLRLSCKSWNRPRQTTEKLIWEIQLGSGTVGYSRYSLFGLA